MEWVKCGERLPEKEGRFCVRLTNGCISTDYYTPDDNQSDPKFKWKHYPVSAWLQLPEAYYPGCKGEHDWKRIHEEFELQSLSEGDYFVTVGDLVYIARKGKEFFIAGPALIAASRVDAVMPVPVRSENNKLDLF